MSPYILLFFTFIFGCSNPIDNSEKTTFFIGIRDEQIWLGDGVAFSHGDTSLHIRGISGDFNLRQQIDIVIKVPRNISSGSYPIDSTKASINEISGGDDVGGTFRSRGDDSDFITIDWNKQDGFITGEFRFVGWDQETNTVSLKGQFHIEVGESGTPWVCGFTRREPTDEGCKFIK